MIINKIILFYLLITNAFAQDCNGLKDNEVQRLDQPGKSLATERIQDQDGLGTCYANATSVALQSALPGNPDVSYLQLAFASGQKNALSQKAKNSAYYDNSNESLIEGGNVCETFNEVKSSAIGGVCKREDVALEKSLFNLSTNSLQDSQKIQKKLIYAISASYDSLKSAFGKNQFDSKEVIAQKIAAEKEYKRSFENLIANNQNKYNKEECLKNHLEKPLRVFKNLMKKQFEYFRGKYGEGPVPYLIGPVPEMVNGKKNPDIDMFNFYKENGRGYIKSMEDGELLYEISPQVTHALENNYLTDRNHNRSKNSVTVLSEALVKGGNFNPSVVASLVKDFNKYDKDILDNDKTPVFTPEISERCMKKNALNYYKNDDGFMKDFSLDACLKNFQDQGKKFQSLAVILDSANLNNLDALNNFMTKLPTMTYEQAMRAIVAPDCPDEKKQKIPDSLTCSDNGFDYLKELEKEVQSSTKISSKALLAKYAEEKKKIELAIQAAYDKGVADEEAIYNKSPVTAPNPAMRDEAGNAINERDFHKKDTLIKLKNKRNRELANINIVSKSNVLKKLAGEKEEAIWNKHLDNSKSKFATETIELLKNNNQAVPIALCTTLFNSPLTSQAARDGTCGKDSGDGKYESVGGQHAVTVIGARCQKGKLNYLIQNSWGDWDDIKKAKNSDGSQHFEHEFGKAWMNEDELLSNTYSYQKFSNK